MNTYLITYDLNAPGQDYNELYEAIKEVADSYIHPLDSTWFVTSTMNASSIRGELKEVVDRSDKIIVMKVTTPWAANFKDDDTNWLLDNVD